MALSKAAPTPRELTEAMITTWRRNGEISEQYLYTAREVLAKAQILGTDNFGNYGHDYGLVRALARLDREKIYIVPSVLNIQMGADRLIDFVRTYDGEHAGELSIVKDPKALKCKPEEIDYEITAIIMHVSALYALKMGKRLEVERYFKMMDKKIISHAGRVWLQDELQDFFIKNVKFSEGKYLEEICRYVTKPGRRTVIEQRTRLW